MCNFDGAAMRCKIEKRRWMVANLLLGWEKYLLNCRMLKKKVQEAEGEIFSKWLDAESLTMLLRTIV